MLKGKNELNINTKTWRSTKSSDYKSEVKRQIYDITCIWNLIYGTNEPFHRKETHGLGEQTYGCQEGGEGAGWTGSLGLIDANYCIWSG